MSAAPIATACIRLLCIVALAGCAPGPKTTPASSPTTPVVAQRPSTEPAPVPIAPAPPSSPPVERAPSAPLAVAFTPFGRVVNMDERKPLWSLPVGPTPPRPAPSTPRYERWHEKARANVGYGYLSIIDLTIDERFCLVVSEDEAALRFYEFPAMHFVRSDTVTSYQRFARGDFVFVPVVGVNPSLVMFAGESGVGLLFPNFRLEHSLSREGADALRWTDDHGVLGATKSAIPAQRSRIVFYAFSDWRLEPLLTIDFSERVEEWDLDSSKKKLVVTYYPSNQTEGIDLETRKVVWTMPAPQYANSVDISPDDARVAVGGSAVVMHDMTSGTVVAGDAHFGNNIHRVRFSPSGDALAVSSYEGKIRIFDGRAPGPAMRVRKILRHSGTANVYALAFTRDGTALVSGSGDKTVRVWGE